MHRAPLDPRPDWQKRVEELRPPLPHPGRRAVLGRVRLLPVFSTFEVDTSSSPPTPCTRCAWTSSSEVIDERMFGLFLIPPRVRGPGRPQLGGGRAERLRPVRPRLRRRRPAEAAGVQRRHADGAARGGGRPVVLAQGHRRARRPVQQHPRAADRGLAGRPRARRRPDPLRRPERGTSRTTSPSSTSATRPSRPGSRRRTSTSSRSAGTPDRERFVDRATAGRSSGCSSSTRGSG